jgi:hypothetical protein
MMVIAPVKILDDPNPAMALPIIQTVELGAAPQKADPISKSVMPDKKVHLVSKKV